MLNTHRKMTLLSMFLCLCCTVAFAQSVKGVVKDETGEPVIGVNIVEKVLRMEQLQTWMVNTPSL